MNTTGPQSDAKSDASRITKSDAAWRSQLTAEQYQVTRCHGTERAGSSPLNLEKRAGIFSCVGCGKPLFSSDAKYDSGSGWPSFDRALPGAITVHEDNSYNMRRIEVRCAACDAHLGHVFPDGPPTTGERYCINGVAMQFRAKGDTSP